MSHSENKWVRAAIPALLIHCSIGSVYCWSSFSGALAAQTGLSAGALGWAFSLAIFFLGMSAAFAGRFVERDIRRASLISCLCFTVGLLGTAAFIHFAPSLGPTVTLMGIYLCYGCIMGIGLGIGYLTPVKTLMLWFKDNKGLGTGISIMGFGLAKAFASPVMNVLQEKVGLAAMFALLACVYFVMMFAGHLLLKKPEGWAEAKQGGGVRQAELLKSKVFVGCWVMFYLNITCGLALISFEKPILQVVGLTAAAVSVVQAVTAAFNAAGRIGFSTLSDRLRDRNTVFVVLFVLSAVCSLAAFALGAVAGGMAAVIVTLFIVVNACYGGGFSTMPALLSARFGMRNISEIHGYILSAWAFAGLSGNQLSAFLVERFGSYEAVLAAIAGLYLVALAVSGGLVREKHTATKAPA